MAHIEEPPRPSGYVIKINNFQLGVSLQTQSSSLQKAQFTLARITSRIEQVKNNEVKDFYSWSRLSKKNYLIHGHYQGPNVTTTELSLSAGVDRYLKRDLSHTTLKTYISELKYARLHFGNSRKIDDITKDMIQDWIWGDGGTCLFNLKVQRTGRALDLSSIKKKVQRLKQLFKWLYGKDQIKTDPEKLFSGLEYKRPLLDKYQKQLRDTETATQRQATILKLIATDNNWSDDDLYDDAAWDNVFLSPEETADLISIMETNADRSFEYYGQKDVSPAQWRRLISGQYFECSVEDDDGKAQELPEGGRVVGQYDWNAVRLWGAVVFAAYTGARRSEIIRVTRSDIDLENNVVTLMRVKGRRSDEQYRPHKMPIIEPLKKFLENYLAIAPSLTAIFCDNDNHIEDGILNEERVANKANRLGNLARRAMKDSEFPCLSGFHMYRHGVISKLADDGYTLDEVAAWIGHSTSLVTKLYTHKSLEQRLSASAKMVADLNYERKEGIDKVQNDQ